MIRLILGAICLFQHAVDAIIGTVVKFVLAVLTRFARFCGF